MQTLAYTSVHSSLYAYPTPMSISKNQVGLTNLEIDEVTTVTSLSAGTSPTAESKAPLKIWNKSMKI